MSTLTLAIDLGNDAFQPVEGPEVARLLRELAALVDGGCIPVGIFRVLRDENGNAVGHVIVTEVAP